MEKFGAVSLDSRYVVRVDTVFEREVIPDVSVVVPIFNQQGHIIHNLNQLATCMRLSWELILIDDSSTDNSLKVAIEWAADCYRRSALLVRVRVLSTTKQQFETICDAIGFSLATAIHILEVQSDMELLEPGFDKKLVFAMNSHSDLFMISGRGCHPFREATEALILAIEMAKSKAILLRLMLGELLKRGISFIGLFTPTPTSSKGGHPANTQELIPWPDRSQIFPTIASFRENGRAGRLGGLISQVIEISDIPQGKMWVGETVMRGPLLVHRERYMNVGGLDTLAFFLGNDDHDLAYRAFVTQGYRTAFVPVAFKSPIDQGSTRKRKSLSTMIYLSRQMRRTSKHLLNSGLYSLIKIGEKPRHSPMPEVRSYSLT